MESKTYAMHPVATGYLASLRARGCSPNTERVYAGRVALYLNYCRLRRLQWSRPGFTGLSCLQQWLVETPLPARAGRLAVQEVRHRSRGTANAVMTVVGEFLRFGAARGQVPSETIDLLARPRLLRFAPPGYDVGEQGQFRQVQEAAFRFKAVQPGFEDLSPAQIRRMIASRPRARDRFLIALLACTGLRIGEALGLHREDLHLLASSRLAGCGIEGPHVHVRRRTGNPNRALAKSRFPRTVPVTAELVVLYTDYQYERDRVEQALAEPMVFVNLFRSARGRPMAYANTKEMFDRMARTVGHACRPHMLRHAAATRWLRDGIDRDVVQRLLGHVSPLSMEVYRTVDDAELRAAVEHVASLQGQR
ncbi:tyrosine-type recombinase/integrase [Streptomyces sp. NPDC005236]|uniref:tyrosine-type recombinase/integrase n=1 Tax=Streptomyces sp. NPDC005236 TaxID=3157028 RepID=UPI0033A364CE